MPASRLRRILLATLAGSVLFVALYLLGAAFYLQHSTWSTLRAGAVSEQIAEELGDAPRPEDPFRLGYRGDPHEALGLDFEEITVPTPLGPAPAWLVGAGEADETPGLAAIYVHGVAGGREDGYRHLAMLAQADIPTLLITYRNDPDAPAAPEGVYGFGLGEWEDLEAAVTTMRERGFSRLLLVGESMGGAIVGQFLERSPQAAQVVGIALDAPALEFRAVVRFLTSKFGLPLTGTIVEAGLAMMALTGPFDLREASVSDTFASFEGPLFIAHGTGDRVVPVETSHALVAAREAAARNDASGASPTFSIITTGDHLQSFAEDEAGYRAAFARFLEAVGR